MMTLLSILLYDGSDWGSPSDYYESSDDVGGLVLGFVLMIGFFIVVAIVDKTHKDD